MRRGKLTKWKDDRGFGFIQPVDSTPEVFLHISELKDATRRPQVGDTIYYYLIAEAGKLRACNAFILGARSKSHTSSASSGAAAHSRAASPTAKHYPFPVLETLLLAMLPSIGAISFAWKTTNPIPLILYPTMSLLTFALYADDKSRAKRKFWRTSEQTLHRCELAGGWLGGFHRPQVLNVLFKIFDPIMHWDMTTRKQVLKGDAVHSCKSTRLSKGEFFMLKEHDRNFLTHFSFSHASCS